jgi:hypothetical protein
MEELKMGILRPSYKIEKRVLDAVSIAAIDTPVNQRKVRTGHVKGLYDQLCDGVHFETPICINRKANGTEATFDGWHRTVAMHRFLTENPKEKIQVTLHIYDDLDEDQERDEYSKVNKGMKQTTNDVVCQYKDDIPIFTHMKNGWKNGLTHVQMACPVTSYPSPNSVSFYRLVSAYLACTSKTWGGGYVADAYTFVETAKNMTLQDVKLMNAFLKDFISAFGGMNKNPFLRSTPFQAVMKIWLDNRTKLPQSTMVTYFKKRLVGDASVALLSKSGGTGATIGAHQMFVSLLNAGRKRYLFDMTAPVKLSFI